MFPIILNGCILGIAFRLIFLYINSFFYKDFTFNATFIAINILLSSLIGIAFSFLYYTCMDLKNKNNLLSIYATTDYMTGFLNKRNGIEVLKNQLKILDENGKLSVFFIDINNLKLVNDMYGHKEGDELIITIGRILKQSLRKEDTVCRLGGDEFLVILPNCSFNQAEDVWRRICSNIYEYNQKKLKPYEISVSHGTHECKKGETVEQILFLADQKMYREKSVYKSLKLT